MAMFESDLCKVLGLLNTKIVAWCVLPNHWHALIQTNVLKETIKELGKLHGRISFRWNREDSSRGRTCWHRCSDRRIRSDAHRFAAQNYIHHNPVKHGYAERWEDWPFSSAMTILKKWDVMWWRRSGRNILFWRWAQDGMTEQDRQTS